MTNDRPQAPKTSDRGSEPTHRTWVSRAAGHGSSRMLLIALAVGLCTVVAGVSVAAISSPGRSTAGPTGHAAEAGNSPAAPTSGVTQAAAPTARAAQPRASAPSGRGTAAVGTRSNGISKTALKWPAQLGHQIQRWTAGPGGTELSAVTMQLGNAMQAAAVRLYPVVRQGCASLASSVESARGAPPIPYAVMQQLYAKVLTGLSGAAAECQNAISIRPDGDESMKIDLNKALLSHSLAQFAAASEALYTATAHIRALQR